MMKQGNKSKKLHNQEGKLLFFSTFNKRESVSECEYKPEDEEKFNPTNR
jgi:hypothetical protein